MNKNPTPVRVTVECDRALLRAASLFHTGEMDGAARACMETLSANPFQARALGLLGLVFLRQGRPERAAPLFEKVLLLNPADKEALGNLGLARARMGELDQALAVFSRLHRLDPKDPSVMADMAAILKQKSEPDQACEWWKRALAAAPRRISSWLDLGAHLLELSRIREAGACFSRALELEPKNGRALAGLARIAAGSGDFVRAEDYCLQLVETLPQSAEARAMLGEMRVELARPDQAEADFRKALALRPDFPEALANLGNLLRNLGRGKEAEPLFSRAVELDPYLWRARFGRCLSCLPVAAESEAEIGTARKTYRSRLVELEQAFDPSDPAAVERACAALGAPYPFHLGYHGKNDRELQALHGRLAVRIMSARFPQWSGELAAPCLVPGQKLRLGFVCGHFRPHSVWKTPLRGWIENLDPDRFEIFAYSTARSSKEIIERIKGRATRFVQGDGSAATMAREILSDSPHALIYPEIGMDPSCVRLAALRLAPVQCVSWGHPITSGLETIDYYLSSELMEPPDGQDHYSEKLVRLPNLSVLVEPDKTAPASLDLAQWGVGPGSVRYLCCQSIFKYLPRYDHVPAAIATRVPKAKFLFIRHDLSPRATDILIRRLAGRFKAAGLDPDNHLVFLPRLTQGEFASLNAQSDIFLDSMGWSGFNTVLEALPWNLPIVTLPGRFMRSRHAAAILAMMGATQTIARDPDEYIEIAARLGTNPQTRQNAADEIKKKKSALYKDKLCISTLEDFLFQAVKVKGASGGRGE